MVRWSFGGVSSDGGDESRTAKHGLDIKGWTTARPFKVRSIDLLEAERLATGLPNCVYTSCELRPTFVYHVPVESC